MRKPSYYANVVKRSVNFTQSPKSKQDPRNSREKRNIQDGLMECYEIVIFMCGDHPCLVVVEIV